MKKRLGIQITYELLRELLGLEEGQVINVITSPNLQRNECFEVIVESELGFETLEGSDIGFIPFENLDARKEALTDA